MRVAFPIVWTPIGASGRDRPAAVAGALDRSVTTGGDRSVGEFEVVAKEFFGDVAYALEATTTRHAR